MKYILLICFAVFFSCNENKKEEPVAPEKAEIAIAAIPLLNLNGAPIDWTAYKGKTVFINFWTTWCGPCLEEMPSIQAAMDKLKNENIVFLFASDETTDQINKFKAGHDFNFNYLRIDDMGVLNIVGLPTTMIFDASGQKVFSEMGYRNWNSKENIELLTGIINTK